jgi:hypothetical protein
MGEGSDHLLSEKGREALRNRLGVADFAERHRVLVTAVEAATLGGLAAVGVAFAGLPAGTALLVGGAVALAILTFYLVLSALLRRPVMPFLVGENDPESREVDEGVRFETEAEADRESTRRNMREGTSGYWWIQKQLPSGEWTVERRGRRRPGRRRRLQLGLRRRRRRRLTAASNVPRYRYSAMKDVRRVRRALRAAPAGAQTCAAPQRA